MSLAARAASDIPIAETMDALGKAAREAAALVATASTEAKNGALRAAASDIRASASLILDANRLDMEEAASLSDSKKDRLKLDEARLEGTARALEEIAELPDPVGEEIASWTRPNGLQISRLRTPLGVIGIIYESRPNVTADAGALALKAGNASILRAGSESRHSSLALHRSLVAGLRSAALPPTAIQMAPLGDRAVVGYMLRGLSGAMDVIVPRGGASLVRRVMEEARVPVFAHLEGVCHVYIDRAANAEKAIAVALNAKMRRTGICGAAETLLIDRAWDAAGFALLLKMLKEAGCEIRADEEARRIDPSLVPASEEDWHREYLAPIISVKIVEGVDEAIRHIRRYGSGHTEAILTEDDDRAERFLLHVDSAIVMRNASTQFADGGEFGMGAEIGIGTGRFHARGPIGLEQLTSFKYVVRGDGQCRP